MTEQQLPENYVDPSLPSRDQELLRIFYTASLSEGGSADEVTLRGIRAITDWQLDQVMTWLKSVLVREFQAHLHQQGFVFGPFWAIDVDDVLDDLKEAMRPTQQQQEDN